MRVLLTGSTGFIGRHVAAALEHAGVELTCAVRDPVAERAHHPQRRCVRIDFSGALTPADWSAALKGVDAAINMVGIFRPRGAQSFEALHVRAPASLFAACEQQRVRRVLQLSALGADAGATSRYHLTKRATDDLLQSSTLDATVLEPSLVFGSNGASARFFLQLAALPLIPLPRGASAVQPVHVDDLCAVIERLLAMPPPLQRRVALVRATATRAARLPRRAAPVAGPRPGSVRAGAARAGDAGGRGGPPLARRLARAGKLAHAAAGQRRRCLHADPAVRALAAAGRTLRRGGQARGARNARTARYDAAAPARQRGRAVDRDRAGLVRPVPGGGQPPRRSGMPAPLGALMLGGTAALDLLLGLATLQAPARCLWPAKIELFGFYMLVITLRLPEYRLHPGGRPTKNLPMLAVPAVVYVFEPARTRSP